MLRRLAVLAALTLLVAAWPARAAAPTVDADAYLLVDPATNAVLAQRAPDRELPMASTTKMMTALVTLESADLDDVMTVPPDAAVGGSTGSLQAGERLTVRELLTALLVASGNDAAVTLAEGVAGSQAAFVRRMNRRAAELGLTETHFANPHGLDAPGHHSSARDLVALARCRDEESGVPGNRLPPACVHPGAGRGRSARVRVRERAARHRPRRRRRQDGHDRRRRLRARRPLRQDHGPARALPGADRRAQLRGARRGGRGAARLRALALRARHR